MKKMFGDCCRLTTLDLSGWNTSNVINMSEMFFDCGALTELNLSGWNTSNVTDMSFMFGDCSGLTTLDLSGWNTSKVTNMSQMFYIEDDIDDDIDDGKDDNKDDDKGDDKGDDKDDDKDDDKGDSKLETIRVGAGWSTAGVTKSTDMFYNCKKLPNYDSENPTDKTYAYMGSDGYLTGTNSNVTANSDGSGAYWATFYSDAGYYQAPQGTQVFAVNFTGTEIIMTKIADRIVNMSEGVVLKKNTSGSFTLAPSTSASEDDYSDNSLKGTTTEITNPGNAYVLSKKNAGVGFYKLSSDGTIGANKAYLTYDGSTAREFFGFDETSGIESVSMSDAANGVVYDLQGRRVSQPTKGLYIVNGKKYIKK